MRFFQMRNSLADSSFRSHFIGLSAKVERGWKRDKNASEKVTVQSEQFRCFV